MAPPRAREHGVVLVLSEAAASSPPATWRSTAARRSKAAYLGRRRQERCACGGSASWAAEYSRCVRAQLERGEIRRRLAALSKREGGSETESSVCASIGKLLITEGRPSPLTPPNRHNTGQSVHAAGRGELAARRVLPGASLRLWFGECVWQPHPHRPLPPRAAAHARRHRIARARRSRSGARCAR